MRVNSVPFSSSFPHLYLSFTLSPICSILFPFLCHSQPFFSFHPSPYLLIHFPFFPSPLKFSPAVLPSLPLSLTYSCPTPSFLLISHFYPSLCFPLPPFPFSLFTPLGSHSLPSLLIPLTLFSYPFFRLHFLCFTPLSVPLIPTTVSLTSSSSLIPHSPCFSLLYVPLTFIFHPLSSKYVQSTSPSLLIPLVQSLSPSPLSSPHTPFRGPF